MSEPKMGRPVVDLKGGEKVRRVGVSLPPRLIPVFKAVGGSAWLRAELERRAKRPKAE